MVGNSNKLSKWDEAWLSDKNEEKYDYSIEYIRARWPLEVAQNIPPNWSDSKQNSVRNLFCKLIQETQFDTRGIIRRTKEAWRRHHKESLNRSSGNYTNVKLTDSDKNKMRVLAEEAGLSSVSDVVSSILNNEHKELLANKKLDRDIVAKSKAAMKDKTMVSGLLNNTRLLKLKKENHKLQQELEIAQQKLVTMTEMFSQQLITLERYESNGIDPLSDEELKQAKELAQSMIASFEDARNKATKVG